MSAYGRPLTVVVAVTTFRRPDDLAALLPLLIQQAALARSSHVNAAVLIVDNDPSRSAERVCASNADPRVRYVCEPTPGIAAARNRCLAEAADADLLAFIDDDERPADDWLDQLLSSWRTTRADAISGPVRSRLPFAPEPWIVAGSFFDRLHRRDTVTGSSIDSAATNNLLLDLAAVRRYRLSFDSSFGISGGEDELFTRQLRAAGGRIVWCSGAIVYDEVRADRVNRKWILMRAFSYGTIDCRIALALANSAGSRTSVRLRCVAQGLPRAVVGAVRWWLGVGTRSLRHSALGQQTMMRGLGLMAGSIGWTRARYTRPDAPEARARRTLAVVESSRAGS